MITTKVSEIASQPIFFKLNNFLTNNSIFLKIEGLNIGQSIKLTAAQGMISEAIKKNRIQAGTQLIESSSGNLGVALSMISKEMGLSFTCVIDPNILPENERLMKLFGAKLLKVTKKDKEGGYLGTRIDTILDLVKSDSSYLWLNQYGNLDNPLAHYNKTAQEIASEFQKVDYLFIGVSSTGTIMGCAQYFKQYSPETRIIAVDLKGSVIFENKSQKRFIPGIGASRKPSLLSREYIDDVVLIEEIQAIKICNQMLGESALFLGGSSGAVLAAIQKYGSNIPANSTVVGIAPDFGFKYSDSIYNPDWVSKKYAIPISN